MELLLTSPDSKSFSNQSCKADSFDSGGLLNSKYQSIVKLTHNASSTNSLYRKRQAVKIKSFQLDSSAEVILKLSIFTAVILSIFS